MKWLYGELVCRSCDGAFARRRQCAWVLDAILWWPIALGLGAVLGVSGIFYLQVTPGPGRISACFYSLDFTDPAALFASWIFALLFCFKDGFNGRSPGKRMADLQVVDRISRQPIGFRQSFVRNVLLNLPFVPIYVGLTMFRGRRLGDGWARTDVIWSRYSKTAPFEPRPNICRGCGYDLTGNVSGRCSECGLTIPSTDVDANSATEDHDTPD